VLFHNRKEVFFGKAKFSGNTSPIFSRYQHLQGKVGEKKKTDQKKNNIIEGHHGRPSSSFSASLSRPFLLDGNKGHGISVFSV
jgi:hypothetical protein